MGFAHFSKLWSPCIKQRKYNEYSGLCAFFKIVITVHKTKKIYWLKRVQVGLCKGQVSPAPELFFCQNLPNPTRPTTQDQLNQSCHPINDSLSKTYGVTGLSIFWYGVSCAPEKGSSVACPKIYQWNNIYYLTWINNDYYLEMAPQTQLAVLKYCTGIQSSDTNTPLETAADQRIRRAIPAHRWLQQPHGVGDGLILIHTSKGTGLLLW